MSLTVRRYSSADSRPMRENYADIVKNPLQHTEASRRGIKGDAPRFSSLIFILLPVFVDSRRSFSALDCDPVPSVLPGFWIFLHPRFRFNSVTFWPCSFKYNRLRLFLGLIFKFFPLFEEASFDTRHVLGLAPHCSFRPG
ncbi:hypothetical protein TNCV_1031751 [Trichonephila clavipes]|nr:hypothetical protein TNCV_1031751 [Trichonephila clavipes]